MPDCFRHSMKVFLVFILVCIIIFSFVDNDGGGRGGFEVLKTYQFPLISIYYSGEIAMGLAALCSSQKYQKT